ncbi:MAG TPA: radical SAM protein [Rhizomicrobium sp.]|jgi:anaerobic magnesium-protoporphyrin IX monomethyl ester cyclase
MLKILVAHSYFLNHDSKQLARMTPYSPLSTLIVAALLREQQHEISFFDATFADGVDDFEACLDANRPSMVAIMEDNFNFLTKMCTVRRREAACAMIRMARSRGCLVVVNGPDSTDQPHIYLEAGAHAVLLGEGENALLELARIWGGNQKIDWTEIAGTATTGTDGKVAQTRPRPALRGLDKLPLPAWDLIDAESYRSAWRPRHGRLSWNIATSRGCPYSCNWCAKPTFGRGYEQRSPLSVATELRRIKDTIVPDHIWFADDIFGLTPGWLRDFASEVSRLDARMPFMMQSRVNLMKPEAVEALAEAGAEEVWLGVESGSQKILDAMEKGSQVEDAREATRNLKAHGIRACWFIQLGYPGESWEDLSATRELIRQEGPSDIGVSVAYPLPGTRFHELVRMQLGDRQNWEDSDDLAMLFQGTYDTLFYRLLRDVLHEEVREGSYDDFRWARLGHEGARHRSANPVHLGSAIA